MDNLYIVCVLYNSSISEIASLETFLHFVGKYEFVRLMVLDNSSEQYVSANTAEWEKKYRDRIIYVSNGGNVGLSKAYNRALDTIEDENYYVMYSDDDTTFSEEYIENVIKAIKSGRADIIGGVIYAGDIIISPVEKLKIRPHYSPDQYINKAGVYKDIFCINTGLTVKSSVYDVVGRYDERLFLDAVDLLFADKLILHGINKVEIVDGEIKQNFSTQTNDLSARRKRVKIYTRDWLTWWRISRKHTPVIFVLIFLAHGSVAKRTIMNWLGIKK